MAIPLAMRVPEAPAAAGARTAREGTSASDDLRSRARASSTSWRMAGEDAGEAAGADAGEAPLIRLMSEKTVNAAAKSIRLFITAIIRGKVPGQMGPRTVIGAANILGFGGTFGPGKAGST